MKNLLALIVLVMSYPLVGFTSDVVNFSDSAKLVQVIRQNIKEVERVGSTQISQQLKKSVKINIGNWSDKAFTCLQVSASEESKKASGTCIATGDLDEGNTSSYFAVTVSWVDYEEVQFYVTLLEREL